MTIFGVDDLPVERELVIDRIEGELVQFEGEDKAYPLAECWNLLSGIYGGNWAGQKVVLHTVERPIHQRPAGAHEDPQRGRAINRLDADRHHPKHNSPVLNSGRLSA